MVVEAFFYTSNLQAAAAAAEGAGGSAHESAIPRF
jgi:hypothetical protein